MESDPPLVVSALINGVVADLLYQSDFEFPHYPEMVDLAVVATGLGVLRSGIAFVKKTGVFWDSTQWLVAPRPFLNIPSLAYANALAAWTRGDRAPAWSNDLNGEIRRPMRSSLKYLSKTSDSFFQPADLEKNPSERQSTDWWRLAANAEPSTRIVSLCHLDADARLSGEQESVLVKALQSNNRAVTLHGIAAAERMKADCDHVVRELRSLVNDRDDEVRAKSLCTLTVLSMLDDSTMDSAADMLDSHFKHNVFAGVVALASRDSVPDHVLPGIQRAFMRSLNACDYEFVGLFATAFRRWFEDPQSQVREWLAEDSPDLLQIALDALEGTPQETVSIG